MYKYLLVALALTVTATTAQAEKKCKVSMMGRVCYEVGAEVATAEHMKNNQVEKARMAKQIKADTKLAGTKSAK